MKKRNIAFGYSLNNGRIVINPYEQAILKRICNEYMEGSSLAKIANGLISDKVEFARGIIAWDKARLSRIVDDDRYLGNDDYPQLIDAETFGIMRERKAANNTQSGTDRKSGIYLMKTPVICPDCGFSMHRLQNIKCKCAQKWVCDNCNTEIKITDGELMRDITALLNAVINNTAMIKSAASPKVEPTLEQLRLDNEIARSLEGYDFDKKQLQNKMLERAALSYSLIGDESYILHKLRGIMENCDVIEEFNPDLVNRTVKAVHLSHKGYTSIILINNQEVRKELTSNGCEPAAV